MDIIELYVMSPLPLSRKLMRRRGEGSVRRLDIIELYVMSPFPLSRKLMRGRGEGRVRRLHIIVNHM